MLWDRNPQHWKLWVFYYNPDEPRLFVAKRMGGPLTLNLARPMAWAIIVGTIAIVAAENVINGVHSLR